MARCSKFGGIHIDGKVTCPRCKRTYPNINIWDKAECTEQSWADNLAQQVTLLADAIRKATDEQRFQEVEEYSTKLRQLRIDCLRDHGEKFGT